MSSSIEYRWRGPVSGAEMVTLVRAHGGQGVAGWLDQIRPCSLGWVTARLQPHGGLAGFVNVAWDGGDHAFLLDTKVAAEHQRQGHRHCTCRPCCTARPGSRVAARRL